MEDITLQVSGICRKDGKKFACVTFKGTIDKRAVYAEGIIPDCKITKHIGFEADELTQLEIYLKMNVDELKIQAAKISPIKAIMDN